MKVVEILAIFVPSRVFGFDFDPSEISLTGISGSLWFCRFVPLPSPAEIASVD